MNDGNNNKVNATRIDHLEKMISGINGDVHANTLLLRQTREELVSLKTEMRIFGSLMLGAIGTLIALVLNQIMGA